MIVKSATVFMAVLSRLLLTAIEALCSAIERPTLLSSWVMRLNICQAINSEFLFTIQILKFCATYQVGLTLNPVLQRLILGE
jgi:hypothetical protein